MGSNTALIIENLKSHLKLRGLTYVDLAKAWKLSVSSTKRVMASEDITLSKIDTACELMNISVGEFLQQIPFEKDSELFYLTPDQENKLVKEPETLHYFLLLAEGFSPTEIIRDYTISSEKNIRILNQLERWNLLEVQSKNRVKRKFEGQLRFRKEGPLGKHLENLMKTKFFETQFNQNDDFFTFLNLAFTPGSPQKLKQRLLQLSKDLVAESENHRHHPSTTEFGLVIGLRQWESPFTKAFSRRKKQT
jgi:transcriptional regulator with XRE-family HTH domain